MPFPQSKANFLLKLMGIQPWVRRKDLHKEMQLLQLELKVKQCPLCQANPFSKEGQLGVGNVNAEIFVVQDVTYLKSQSDHQQTLFKNILSSIGLNDHNLYISMLTGSSSTAQFEVCAEHLKQQIQLIKPVLIMVMGELESKLFQPTIQTAQRECKAVHDFQGIPLLYTYSLDHLMLNPKDKRQAFKDWSHIKSCLGAA